MAIQQSYRHRGLVSGDRKCWRLGERRLWVRCGLSLSRPPRKGDSELRASGIGNKCSGLTIYESRPQRVAHAS